MNALKLDGLVIFEKIAVAEEMRLGWLRRFGLHPVSPIELELLSVQRSMEARGTLLDPKDESESADQ